MTQARSLPILALLVGAMGFALAQGTWSTKPSGPPTTAEAAQARLEADFKLCAQEADAQARIQCRRDAQAVHDKAVQSLQPQAKGTYGTQARMCAECGHVTAIRVEDVAGDGNAVGLIAGGVAGAVLGQQVGGGLGKDLATIAGAAGGAYAGKKIQEHLGKHRVWHVTARYSGGTTERLSLTQDPGLAVGDAVRKSGSTWVRD